MNNAMNALRAAHEDLLQRLQELGFGSDQEINGGDVVDTINAWRADHHLTPNGGSQ